MQYLVVIGKDYSGFVTDICQLLEKHQINIDDIHAESNDGNAVVRLNTSDNQFTISVLTENNFNAMSQEAVLVKVPDQPGVLAKLSRQLNENGVDIRGLNRVYQSGDYSIVAISTSNDAQAKRIFADILI